MGLRNAVVSVEHKLFFFFFLRPQWRQRWEYYVANFLLPAPLKKRRGGLRHTSLTVLMFHFKLGWGAPLLHLLHLTSILYFLLPLFNRQSVSIIRLSMDFSLLPLKFQLTYSQIVGICSNVLPGNRFPCLLPSWRKKKNKKDWKWQRHLVLGISFSKRCRISFQIIFWRWIKKKSQQLTGRNG